MAEKFQVFMPNNCPIREHTADRVSVGRCFFYCPDGECPRHGDVTGAMATYKASGKLTNDFDLKKVVQR